MIKKLIGRKEINPSAEMSFIDHLEELRWHLIRALIAVGIASIIVFVNIEYVVDRILMGPVHPEFITYQWLCQLGNFLHLPEIFEQCHDRTIPDDLYPVIHRWLCTGIPLCILGNMAICAPCPQP